MQGGSRVRDPEGGPRGQAEQHGADQCWLHFRGSTLIRGKARVLGFPDTQKLRPTVLSPTPAPCPVSQPRSTILKTPKHNATVAGLYAFLLRCLFSSIYSRILLPPWCYPSTWSWKIKDQGQRTTRTHLSAWDGETVQRAATVSRFPIPRPD